MKKKIISLLLVCVLAFTITGEMDEIVENPNIRSIVDWGTNME